MEIAYPIEDPDIKARLIADLDLFLSDNLQAWELQPDGTYIQLEPKPDAEPTSAQMQLLADLSDIPLQQPAGP